MRDVEVCSVCLSVLYDGCRPGSSVLQHLATFASLYMLHNRDYVYPKEEIDIAWEKVLLNQCGCTLDAC
jgi:hypothetical protein